MAATLHETSRDAAFTDAAGCARWLKTVPLINAAPAHRALTTRLVALNAVSIDSEERLAILELLRQPVVYVQAELGRSFAGHPLPLGPGERDTFRAVIALWDSLARGYELAIQGLAGNVFASVTLALQRALDAVARRMLEYQLAHVQVPAATYASLHRLYRLAEKLSRAREKVADPLAHSSELATCTRTWVRALLLDAGSPREQRAKQILLVNRLLERWAPKVAVLQAPPEAPKNPPIYANLDEPKGLARVTAAGSGLRVLEMSALAKSLAKRIVGLRRGQTLEALGLPEDCHQPGCEALLTTLYRQWCEGSSRRTQVRTVSHTRAEVCIGIAAAHYYLSGRPFYPPDHPPTLDGAAYRVSRGIAAEEWVIRDESVGGIGLARSRDPDEGTPLEHGRLLLVRPHGGSGLLASIQWLQEADAGDLQVGAQLLAAGPCPVSARLAEDTDWQPALLLPAALNTGRTLVARKGSYGPGRGIEIYTDAFEHLQVTGLVAQGADFERLAVAPLQ